jgi:hypothetical protein
MIRRIGILGLACIGLLVPALACDDLTLPAQPDAGNVTPPVGDGGGGSNPSLKLPAYAPANAIAGDVVQAYNTTIANWATLDTAGKVNAVSWNLPLIAVTSLESATFMGRQWMNVSAEVKRDTALTGLAVDFLPTGHLPNGIYNVQHWEFHIAFQAIEEVKTIDCADPTMPAFNIIPPVWSVLPPPDNCFPAMGIHAISGMAPEFNGQRFTFSNLLVYYRGNGSLKDVGAKLTSFEPKATTQLFKERKSFNITFPTLPAGALGRAANVPSTLSCNYDSANDAYVMTASGFVPAT